MRFAFGFLSGLFIAFILYWGHIPNEQVKKPDEIMNDTTLSLTKNDLKVALSSINRKLDDQLILGGLLIILLLAVNMGVYIKCTDNADLRNQTFNVKE